MEKGKIDVNCKALVIGGSAGGLDVILSILPKLKGKFSFPIVIVLHRKNSPDSFLSDLLSYRTKMPVTEIEDKEKIVANHIYVAPPDYHLLFEKAGHFSLDMSAKINYSRPSIDVSFESASDIYSEHLVCILLSGANADGVNGLKKVKSKGGFAIVQNPSTAKVAFMPEQAIANNYADLILDPDAMAAYINNL